MIRVRFEAMAEQEQSVDAQISERAQRIASGNSLPGDFDEMNALTRQRGGMAVSRSVRDRLIARALLVRRVASHGRRT